MPNVQFRANLSSTIFPFLSKFFGRTVVKPNLDININKYATNKADIDKDAGIPQVYFMENVLPTDFGFSSVGYLPVVSKIADTANVEFISELKDDNGFPQLYAYVVDTVNEENSGDYVLSVTAFPATWTKLDADFVPISTIQNSLVTTGYVNGRQFIFYTGSQFREYIGGELVDETMNGLLVADIIGICSVGQYLIAWTSSSVMWSSLIDPTDFDPSVGLETGAGGLTPTETRGPILVCHPIKDGFLIYTSNNVVSATITDDVSVPFVFREVSGSAGILSPDILTSSQNLPAHVIRSSIGISQVDKTKAAAVFPEAADFLSLKTVENIDRDTLEIKAETYTTDKFISRVTSISVRYSVISFGTETLGFTHSLVYDLSLNKWGRLKHTHDFCVLWPYNIEYLSDVWAAAGETLWGSAAVADPMLWDDFETLAVSGTRSNKQLISFIAKNGSVSLVTMGLQDTRDGVFITGKYQLERNTIFQLTGFDIESVNPGESATAAVLTSFDGSAISKVTEPYLQKDTGNSKVYKCRVSGINHSICIQGVFDLSCILLEGNSLTKG